MQMDKFCDDIRRMMPLQQIMFLVGKPDYLAVAPGESETVPSDGETDARDVAETMAASTSSGTSQRWGILEACRRISAVRSKLDARSRAMRELPEPKRDSETSRPQRKNELENLLAVPEFMEETQ
jgi:hypothetical protein